ncbi:MAG: hypothetical protein LBJ24_07230, partial [Treponema sp.]|nr:hypothetical protein [Treponema sp.]
MEILVKFDLFNKVANTGTHNLTPDQDNPNGRAAAVGKFFGNNIDFRGKVGTIFEGMQFIYNNETGEIVT